MRPIPAGARRYCPVREFWRLTYLCKWTVKDLTLTSWAEGKGLGVADVVVIKNTSFHMPGEIASNDGPMTLQIIIDNADFPFKGTEKPTQEDEVPVRRECNAEKEFRAELEWGGEQAPE